MIRRTFNCVVKGETVQIRHVKEYPTMHYFGIPKPTVSMKSKEYDSVKVVLGVWSEIALWECF